MSLSRLCRSLGLVAALAFLMAPGASYAQTGGLTGKVTLQDGSSCVGCPILIERQDIHGLYKTKTDKQGKYTYIGLPLGIYKITLESPSGETLFFFGNKRVDMGEPTAVDFNLPKEIKRSQQNPEYQKQAEEQEKEQKRFAGLKQLYTEGNALFAANKFDEAAAKFKEAEPFAKGKNLLAIEERLAEAYAQGQKYDEAVATYQKVLEMNPDGAGIHNNLGSVYAHMGKIDLAKAEFQKAAELDPKGAGRYYFNLGVVLYNGGKMDEASGAFKKATELDASYADAYFYLGQSLLGKATTDAAGNVVTLPGTREAYETYLKLQPNGPNAAAAQGVLQTLQGAVQTKYVKKKKGR
jgi:tetratricopeptide (TPR) repeat protein